MSAVTTEFWIFSQSRVLAGWPSPNLKANEQIHLPLQAADYWLRVCQQLQKGEIARHEYFPGIALQDAPPIVYLVAPALRFHPATDDLLNYLSPGMEIVRVGSAESWRRGLRVVMRS